MGRRGCVLQSLDFALLSIHHMWNFTHTEASKIRKCAVSGVDKNSDYWDMNIIQFKNILWVYPMGMIPESVSNNDRADPKTVKSRKKQNLASGVDVGKYRSPRSPSIAPTAALNTHKEVCP